MPENKKQGFIFGVIMSYAMAFGMEIYNSAINLGFNLKAGGFSNMTNKVFAAAMSEILWIGIVVIILSSLYGLLFYLHYMGINVGNTLCVRIPKKMILLILKS